MASQTWLGRAVAAAALAVSCASTPPPRDEIADAEEAIAQARARDAATHAPAALRTAEDKLAEARGAARENEDKDENRTKARRLAEEAKVDAQVALAESERAQTQRDVDELARTIEALEREVKGERD
jgi:hypothetical protein